jgi:hypothetical protein
MTSAGHNGGTGANGGPGDEFEDLAGAGGGERSGESARERDRRGFDDFDDLIRDPEYGFDDPFDEPFGGSSRGRGDPGASRARFSDSAANGANGERGITDTIVHLMELVAGAAGDALPPETRRRLEGMLRDLLVALRDSLDRMIERLEERDDYEVEIEEIRID